MHNIAVMPHSFYDGPGLLAAIHTTAALGTADSMIEWRRFDLETTIYGDTFTPKRGRIAVPQAPGLGIDPDPDVIKAYRAKLRRDASVTSLHRSRRRVELVPSLFGLKHQRSCEPCSSPVRN
jgi:hypothetical protein